MGTLRTIEIDFDIHQMIELERRGFDEPEYIALRRLLGLPTPKTGMEIASSAEKTKGRSWSGKGVVLPHGTKLQMKYKGRIFRGCIENGVWVIDGQQAKSPSDAAGVVAELSNGKRVSLNGWIYWEVKRPNDTEWRPIEELRP